MVKHNNVIPNGHFKKKWESRVKTWLNQPARKLRRRENRVKKAIKVAPRPVSGPLRPVVQCPTRRYNMRTRFGRGFTLTELKDAGISPKEARTIGITVDHRRQNQSEESLKANVQRLRDYRSRVVVFPRKAGKPKQGDAEAADLSVAQHTGVLLPITKQSKRVRAQKITAADRSFQAVRTLQAARTFARMEGVRARMAREKEEEKK